MSRAAIVQGSRPHQSDTPRKRRCYENREYFPFLTRSVFSRHCYAARAGDWLNKGMQADLGDLIRLIHCDAAPPNTPTLEKANAGHVASRDNAERQLTVTFRLQQLMLSTLVRDPIQESKAAVLVWSRGSTAALV